MDFQDGGHGGPDAYYQFRVNSHLELGEEAKYRFSRWPSWIYDRHDFSYF